MKSESQEWNWVAYINKSTSNRGVSVAGFDHAPLGDAWQNLYPLGVIGEYVYEGTVERRSESDGNQDWPKAKYWFAKIVDTCGYYALIEFVGYSNEHRQKLDDAKRWILYTDLKPISTYTDNPACEICSPIDVDMPIRDTLELIYSQMIGKLGVPRLGDAFLKHKRMTKYKIGTKVEITDNSCVNKLVIGFVGKIVGCRTSVMYWDSKGEIRKQSESYWCHGSSENIHPVGWGAAVGVPDAPPVGPETIPLRQEELGVDLVNPAIATIKEDTFFEMVNPLDYNKIVAAKVTKVLKYGFFLCKIMSDIHQDSLDKYAGGCNQFHLHITSPLIMACGTCEEHGVSILPPKDGPKRAFEWNRYLFAVGGEALEIPDRDDEKHYDHLQIGLRLEAVDHVKPSLICPAIIVQVMRPHLIRVRYLGWTSEYDQWKPMDSSEVYPAGWCDLVGYPLTKPGANSAEFEDDAAFDFVPPPLPELPTPPPPRQRNPRASAIPRKRHIEVSDDDSDSDSDSESEESIVLESPIKSVEVPKLLDEDSHSSRRKLFKRDDSDESYKPGPSRSYASSSQTTSRSKSKSAGRELEATPETVTNFKKETTTPPLSQPSPKSRKIEVADSKDRMVFSGRINKRRTSQTEASKSRPLKETRPKAMQLV